MIEFFITVTLKETPPIPLPVRRTRHEFRFCAESADVARALASSNVKSKGFPHDVKEIQVIASVPVLALIPIRYCMECRKPTSGSIGQAGYYWPRLCQPCKDQADGVLNGTIQMHVAVRRSIGL